MTPSRIATLAAVLLLSSCDGTWHDQPDDQAETLARLAPGKQSCAVDNGGCSPDALCTRLGRQRTWCTCKTGFAGNGLRCVPAGSVVMGRCALRGGPCAPDATCTQLQPNRAACACKAGFDGNGLRCTDINECATDGGGCDANAICTNTPGSRTCACNAGYEGDGFTCTLVRPKGPFLVVTPDKHDFGSGVSGGAWPAATFTVTNRGDADTAKLEYKPVGADARLFPENQDVSNQCWGKPLAPGQSCQFSFRFAPDAATKPGLGIKTSEIHLFSGLPTVLVVTLTGTVEPAGKGVLLQITPDSADFGPVSAGTEGPYRSFTVANVGDTPTLEMKVTAEGPDVTLFKEKDNGCRTKLLPSQSCSIRLIFFPPAGTAPGAKSATWTVGPPDGPLVSAKLTAQVPAQ